MNRDEIAKKYPDAVRMAPNYQPLYTTELINAGPHAIEQARVDGLRRLQAQIDARKARKNDAVDSDS
jgi:hypothetical protein